SEEFKPIQKSLHELHRQLLAGLKKEHERIHGKVLNPAEWFQILLSAPEYAWIKPLNSLISDVDALLESHPVSKTDQIILQHELERFFFKDDGDVTSFNYHYRKLFAHNHDVMFSHGHLKQAFSTLPGGETPANIEEIRRGWHKIGASKRKLLN
ncbi:MAG: hypothetical protein ACXVA9_05645, partial [Bdellovibrionales bacterium]